MAEAFTPPEVAASAARRGLRLAARVDGIDRAALKRAAAIAERKPHTLAEVGKLIAAHALSASKRPANIGTDASPTPWLVSWLLLGGAPGQEWAASVWRRKGNEDEAARMGLARWSAADVHHGVCVVVRLSPELAGQFPAVINLGGNGAPHVTVAYFKSDPTTPRDALLAEVRAAVAAACNSAITRPFALALPGGIGEFFAPPDETTRPVYAVVQSPGLLAFRAELFRALRGKPWADAARDAFGGYAPHATLAYLPKGQAYDGPQPRGQMIADAVEVWVESHAYNYPITGEPEPVLSMTRRGAALRLSREAPPPPAAMRIHNPDGLHLGRPFRVLTADETVRDGATGEALGCFPAETLAEFVRVFEARCARGEGVPRIDYNHGPSRGMDPTLFGAVVGCYVADDGERGPGLYVVPGWTDYGRDFVAQHATPDGGSLLSNSPEFMVGPAYARGGGDPDEVGELLGGAELLGVALTGTPQQPEGIIDPVRLSRSGYSTAGEAGEVSSMDPEQVAGVPGEERIAKVEAQMADLVASVARLGEVVEAIGSRLAEGDDKAVEMVAEGVKEEVAAVTAEAVEEVRAAAEGAMAQLSTEEAEEVEAEMPAEMALSIRRNVGSKAQRVAAWAKRRDLALAKVQGREVRALSKQVEALKAAAIEAECNAEMTRLRAEHGLPAGDEPVLRGYFKAKRANPQAWAAMHGGACPYEREVKALAERKRFSVPMGRAGVTVQPGEVGAPLSRATIREWAKANGYDYDKDPAAAVTAWSRATGQSYREVTA